MSVRRPLPQSTSHPNKREFRKCPCPEASTLRLKTPSLPTLHPPSSARGGSNLNPRAAPLLASEALATRFASPLLPGRRFREGPLLRSWLASTWGIWIRAPLRARSRTSSACLGFSRVCGLLESHQDLLSLTLMRPGTQRMQFVNWMARMGGELSCQPNLVVAVAENVNALEVLI
ncbi:hypothetical protein VPH35_117197 [Triticum aestivum]